LAHLGPDCRGLPGHCAVLQASTSTTGLDPPAALDRAVIRGQQQDAFEGRQLEGKYSYSVTFAKGQEPPVKGFWSLTVYNDKHVFHPNALKRYSLGTKSKSFMKYNPDGSLTLYFGAKSPGQDKESNWVPAPEGAFSLYIRAYWADPSIINGSWTPPDVVRSN
jgi:hypothetical protein